MILRRDFTLQSLVVLGYCGRLQTICGLKCQMYRTTAVYELVSQLGVFQCFATDSCILFQLYAIPWFLTMYARKFSFPYKITFLKKKKGKKKRYCIAHIEGLVCPLRE